MLVAWRVRERTTSQHADIAGGRLAAVDLASVVSVAVDLIILTSFRGVGDAAVQGPTGVSGDTSYGFDMGWSWVVVIFR